MAIEHTKNFLQALTHLGIEAIEISQSGVGFSAYRKVMALVGEMKSMIHEAKESLPELKQLDGDDALELGHLAYECISEIIMAAAGE